MTVLRVLWGRFSMIIILMHSQSTKVFEGNSTDITLGLTQTRVLVTVVDFEVINIAECAITYSARISGGAFEAPSSKGPHPATCNDKTTLTEWSFSFATCNP